MIYYSAIENFTNYRKDKTGFTVIREELFTEHEMQKYNLPKQKFIKVKARKIDTYFSFGVRKFYRGTDVIVLED